MQHKMFLVSVTTNGHVTNISGPFLYNAVSKFIDTTMDRIGETAIDRGLSIIDYSSKKERQSYMTDRIPKPFIELGKIEWRKTPAIHIEFGIHEWYTNDVTAPGHASDADIIAMTQVEIEQYFHLHQTQMLVEKACENTKSKDLIEKRKADFAKLQSAGIPTTKIPWTPEMEDAWNSEIRADEINADFDAFIEMTHEFHHKLLNKIERVLRARREAAAVPLEKFTTPIGGQHPFGYDRE